MTKSEENKTDRRGFLRRTAIVGVATTGVAATVNRVFPSLVPETSVFETNRSLWAQALPQANLPLQKDIEVDVAVIGGGFTGLSAAYYLKKNSEHARSRFTGGCALRKWRLRPKRGNAPHCNRRPLYGMEWDPNLDKRIYDLTADNARRLLALSAQINCDAEIEINGALQMCNTKEIAKQAHEYAEKAQRAGIPCEFWDQQKIASVVGTSAYPAALYDPNSGQVHPGKLVRMFKRAAELSGGKFTSNHR